MCKTQGFIHCRSFLRFSVGTAGQRHDGRVSLGQFPLHHRQFREQHSRDSVVGQLPVSVVAETQSTSHRRHFLLP